jgi:signal transduction histidine kinase
MNIFYGGENVTESAKSQNDDPLGTPIPTGEASLGPILYTGELHRRPSRPPDHEEENHALVALMGALAGSPSTILQTLAETILEIAQSDCAGLGQPTKEADGRRFYWPAIAGKWNRKACGGSSQQAELEHMTRVMTMGQVAASIAHEVSQPLSGIVTNASTCLRMLDANPPNLEGARETARRTIRDGHRASEVIARLRALFSKKSAPFEPFDLNEAAEEVIALFTSELQEERVVLQRDLAADLPPVLGDRIQIQQVILNLARNASDAMSKVDDRPRELLIKTERDQGGGARLSVKDRGVGIDSRIEEKLFEAFYTTKGDGMGIGLSVSRTIMERHRGRLWAIPNEGPGATFIFAIPCSTDT